MKKIWAPALLLVLFPVVHQHVQDNSREATQVYREVAGEYEFYFPKAYILVRLFVDKGVLWTQAEGEPSPERAIPVDHGSLLFKIDDPKKEQYLRFLRDPNDHISACLLTIKGGETSQEINGRKITRKERPIDARCSVQELEEDFQKAREAMERLHPALPEFTGKEKFEKLGARQLGLLDKPMTVPEFYSVLAPFVAAIGCGHSRLMPPDRFWEEKPACFPLGLTFLGTTACVTRLFDPDLPIPLGSQILSINDQAMPDFLKWVMPAISADGLRETGKWAMLNKSRPQRCAVLDLSFLLPLELRRDFRGFPAAGLLCSLQGQPLALHHRAQPLQFRWHRHCACQDPIKESVDFRVCV
jgi:hypothetical protein